MADCTVPEGVETGSGDERATVTLVEGRNGRVHITVDGVHTVCGAAVAQTARTWVSEDWPELIRCYNCSYRHTPPGYLPPRSGQDFPLRKRCPQHPQSAADSCTDCDPSQLRPHNWPCPNGCPDPAEHSSTRLPRCVVWPPTRQAGPEGRCGGGCESKERALQRANPGFVFDLADSASFFCYHCDGPVCVSCGVEPVDAAMDLCQHCDTAEPGHEPAPAAPALEAPRRAREKWTETEHQQLIELLRDGLPLDVIAARLGRGVDAVASRCRRLLPPERRVRRAEADLELRACLAEDPDYDWRAVLRADAARRGRFYWSAAADDLLREGWTRARPLGDLTEATGASELEVAARLVELKLAESTLAVAARMGCEPGGTLEVRLRMASDRAAAAVWVLVADGLRGSERARPLDQEGGPRAYRHVSLHPRRQDADRALQQLLADHLQRGGTSGEVTVTLAQRTVGDLGLGETHHQQAPTPSSDEQLPS